jgi:16S rRNA (adenine1518-N6/adenine1519-N6)-dimethyltransferase
VLAAYGLNTRKRFGQHFLIDPFVLNKIINAANINENDCVLEIGPGIGAVTQGLVAAGAGHVLAVELDTALIPVLRTLFYDRPVTILQGDILKINLTDALQPFANKTLKVVANLPYYVTTPVLMHLLETGPRLASITVMIQKEVAHRMAAKPNTRDYGALSLAVQYYADIYIAANVPPNCFMPRPAVDSAVVHLTLYDQPPVETDKRQLFDVIRAAFNQRRKTLANALSARLNDFNKDEIMQAIADCGLNADIRGEALGMAEFATLTKALYK